MVKTEIIFVKKFFSLFIFFYFYLVFANPSPPTHVISKRFLELIEVRGSIIETLLTHQKEGRIQKLDHYALAYHPKSCQVALRTVRQYESYHLYLPFIKESRYNNETKMIYFLFETPLIPVRLALIFQLERIQKPGVYPYTFVSGIFPGLKGDISVFDHKKGCLFLITAKWEGKATPFPNTLLEIFIKTLTLKAIESLIRASSL